MNMSVVRGAVVAVLLLVIVSQVRARQNKILEMPEDSVIYRTPKTRQPKFFSLFHIVQFPNEACTADSTTTGVCYSSYDCDKKGGVKRSTCAAGFGQCCAFEVGCNRVVSEKVVYFRNPDYPSKNTGPLSMCSVRMDITDADICQVRLDFQEFDIANPEDGTCKDTFTVPGRDLGFEAICGKNTGQHIYVPVDHMLGSSSVNMRFDINSASEASWKIKATQVKCSDRIPDNCLQYFTNSSGVIESFNFQDRSGRYFKNLDYAICIKKTTDRCKVKLSAADNDDFKIAQEAFASDTGYIDGDCDNAVATNSRDYLVIPQASSNPASGQFHDKFCGDRLILDTTAAGTSVDVYSYTAGPVVIQFHTDNLVKTYANEVGFRLSYSSC